MKSEGCRRGKEIKDGSLLGVGDSGSVEEGGGASEVQMKSKKADELLSAPRLNSQPR